MRSMIPGILLLAASATAQDPSLRFEIETLGGQRLDHEDFANNVLLVDFWGTWCKPCAEAVPVLQGLYAKYKHHGLEIVGLTYEGAGDDAAAAVRAFAAEHGVTYHLALGTPAHKQLVAGTFAGYPTLLFVGRGLALDHAKVGFRTEDAAAIEDWVRTALGLAPLARDAAPVTDPPADAQEPLPLPAGVIFQPGDGDTGFAFEVEDVDGVLRRFADLRGKPVVLALTSTWDATAKATAALMQSLHERYGADAHVLAASLELGSNRAPKVEKIAAFRAAHGLGYPIFPAGLGFQKKIYQFSGMPMFLVFDQDGVLVLREAGADATAEEGKRLDAVREKIELQVGGLLGR